MASRKRKIWWILPALLLLIAIVFFLGPKPTKPDFSKLKISGLPADLKQIEDSVRRAESLLPLKTDNEARFVWYTPYAKTNWSIVYLHGNAASQEEGDPVHEALAYRYGANLFLSRLSEQGLQTENPMLNISAEGWMQSALDAVNIGNAIGDKVLLLSTSTGSTLALYLAAQYPELVDAHIMMSPNIDVYDKRSFLLTMPFGLQIARKITGSEFYGWKAPGIARDYWYTNYRLEGLVTLKTIINSTMCEKTFRDVDDPALVLYYYKDENNQDKVVSVSRMMDMYEQLGTDPEMKKSVALADAGTHIIGSDIFNDNIQSLWEPVIHFCEEVLRLTPVNESGWKEFIDPSALK